MRLGPIAQLTVIVPSLAAELAAWSALDAQVLESGPLERSRSLRLGYPELDQAISCLLSLPACGSLRLRLIEHSSAELHDRPGWRELALPALDEGRLSAAAGWTRRGQGWCSPAGVELQHSEEGVVLQVAAPAPPLAAAFYLGLGALQCAAGGHGVTLRGEARLQFVQAPEGAESPARLSAGMLLTGLLRTDEQGRRSPLDGDSQILRGPGGELVELL